MADNVHGEKNMSNNVQPKSMGHKKKKRENKKKKVSNNAKMEHSSKGGTFDTRSKDGPSKSSPLTEQKVKITCLEEFNRLRKSIYPKLKKLISYMNTLLQRAQKYKYIGNVHFKMRQYDEAIAEYNKAIDICPKEKVDDLAIFYQNRAAANEQLKKYSSVEADCTKALELNSKYTKALLRRARALEQTGDLEAALKDSFIVCIHEDVSNKTSFLKLHEIYVKLVEQQVQENLANRKFLLPSKYTIKIFIASFPKDPVFSRLQHPTNFPQFFKKPLEALKNAEYDDIIPLCTEIIKSDEFDKLSSSKLEVLLLRATFYILLGDYVSAIRDFESILNSEDATDDVKICALIKRARVYVKLEMLEIAFEDFELAISINARYGDIYYQRGQTYLLMEKLDDAKQDFERAVECNSNFGMAYLLTCYVDFKLAEENLDLRLTRVVVKKFERAFKRFLNPPESIYCYTLYADIMSETELCLNFKKADACLAKAIVKYPEYAVILETRGLLQLQWHDNIDKAMEYFNKAIELDYKCETAYKELGKLEIRRENFEKAIKLLDKALIFCCTYKELLQIYILRNSAKVQLDVKNELGSIPPILRSISDFIKIQNVEKPDWLKRTSSAVQLETFLQKAQKYNNVGNVYFKMGKQNEAIVQYNKAVDICPKENVANLAIFYQNRAAAYEQLKKYSSVKADCTKALELNPEYTKAFRRRAHVLEQIGDLEAAIKDWIAVCVDEGFSDHVSLSKADKVLDKFRELHIKLRSLKYNTVLEIQCAEESWMQKKLLMPIKYSIELYFMTFSKDPVFCRLQCPENIPEFFKKPFKAFKDQKYDDIIPLCTEIIKSPEFETLSSTKLEILLLRATFYLLMGDYSAAIQDFENVLSNEDLSDDLRINVLIKRADLHMQLKYFEKSFEDFELAISINSTCSDIYYHRGWAHVFMHRENEAKLDFEKALEYNPNFITAHIQKCCLDYCIAKSNGDIILIKAAIEAVERTFVKYQNFPECKLWYLLYTEIMLSFQQYQKVDTYLAKVIEKDPKCALAYINRGLIQLCNGNIGKSMEYIHKAIKIDEKFGLPYEILGIIETKKGNLEDAIRLFDKAIIYSTTFKEVLTICKEKIATKIELYIRNQLDIEHTPRLFQSFSRFSDIHIEAELLDCLIS